MKNMRDLFVPEELAIKMQDAGFDEDCICGYATGGRLVTKVSYSSGSDCECRWDKKYDAEVRAATWNQAIYWFREKHNIHIETAFRPGLNSYRTAIYSLKPNIMFGNDKISIDYYEALTKAIEEALKLI